MAAKLYPELPYYVNVDKIEPKVIYNDLVRYAGEMKSLLEQRDLELNTVPSFRIYSVVTVTDIGSPSAGDVAFSLGESKFKGYDGTNWQDFH